jgi:N4-gp56 family major capsid protein
MQLWNTDNIGGYMYSDELSEVLRTAMQPMSRFRQHCDADDASDKGKHKGDEYNWNIYSDVATQGAALTENVAMPETNFTISRGSLSIVEYGNSVPYSGLLDDMSKHPVTQIINKALKNDANKTLEAAAHAQFDATLLNVEPTSGTSTTAITWKTDGTSVSTNNLAMSNVHVKLIVDGMKERNIPTWSDGNYRSIGRPATFRDFKDDLESLHSYVDKGFGMILNGEVGREYSGCRFFEQTTIASEGWTNGASDAAYFFGELKLAA